MSTWITVNGARIEKEYFEANLQEAKGYNWNKIDHAKFSQHAHCMICGVTIDPKTPLASLSFKSKGGYICCYCYDHFLAKGTKTPSL